MRIVFVRFVVDFTDDPGTSRVVWLFSLVLGPLTWIIHSGYEHAV